MLCLEAHLEGAVGRDSRTPGHCDGVWGVEGAGSEAVTLRTMGVVWILLYLVS